MLSRSKEEEATKTLLKEQIMFQILLAGEKIRLELNRYIVQDFDMVVRSRKELLL